MNLVDQIMKYESDEMTEEEVVDFFQELLDTGTLFHLQGHYQRYASALLHHGVIEIKDSDLDD
tara:strand:- start:190 stop:378 length:189 start_codon:yes stop_codon:yes gene_type:complete